MNAIVTPAILAGTVEAISSKSDAHRHLICAALCDDATSLLQCNSSEDIDATLDCLRALGAAIERRDLTLEVKPLAQFANRTSIPTLVCAERGSTDDPEPSPLSKTTSISTLDCAESGSTLRFLLPVAAACLEASHFEGRGRLPKRPLGDLVNTLRHNGVTLSSDQLPLTLKGPLQSGCFAVPGNISSQYITGLLFALPLLKDNSEIKLTTALESAAYVDITLAVLRQYKIAVERTEEGFFVPGNQRYQSPGKVVIEGDWSNAAFFLSAGAIAQPATFLSVTGLTLRSSQGDKKVVEFLQQFGAEVALEPNKVSVTPSTLHGCTIDIAETPDLLPVLAVVAATAEGTTHFCNAARLRLKESDRLQTTAAMIRSLGGQVEELAEGLVVHGGGLKGGSVDSYHDHRIAMAAAIAATVCSQPVIIYDAGAVAKSYPAFYDDYQTLGGRVDVI